jgi:hypothetical protein
MVTQHFCHCIKKPILYVVKTVKYALQNGFLIRPQGIFEKSFLR